MENNTICEDGIKPCPFCGEAWLYDWEESGHKIQCKCGFAWRATKWSHNLDCTVMQWNDLVDERVKLLEDVRAIIEKFRGVTDETT